MCNCRVGYRLSRHIQIYMLFGTKKNRKKKVGERRRNWRLQTALATFQVNRVTKANVKNDFIENCNTLVNYC